MSKSSAHSKRRKTAAQAQERPLASDRTIYIGLLAISAFIIFLAFLLILERSHWKIFTVIYAAVIAYLVNLQAFRAYRGRQLANWQSALARLPLHWVGYKRTGGRPLAAAHDQPRVLRALFVSIVISLLIIAALALALIPGLRFW
jgi:hypothetical protein